MIIMLIISCIFAGAAYMQDSLAPLGQPVDIGLPAPREWISSSTLSWLVSIVCMMVSGLLIIYINRVFNVMRSLTALMASLFFIMQTALPSVVGSFYGGDLMVLLMLMCVVFMFSSYSDPTSQRSIYLIFFIITLFSFTDLSAILYLPVLLLGFIQMRIFNLRTLLAAAMGFITPPWILFGFGIVTPDQLTWPDLTLTPSSFPAHETIQAGVAAGYTLVLGVGFTIANLLKILSYNARIRAFNGLLTLLLFATGVFAIINFSNFTFYIPLLNCLTAYQIAHFFTYRRSRRSYIPIILIMLSYIGIYFWAVG